MTIPEPYPDSDTLAWAMIFNGVNSFLHYLDDFLFMGPPQPGVVNRTLQIALDTYMYAQLNFPVATVKSTGLTRKLVFLGIEINTTSGSLALPAEKLRNLKILLSQWHNRKAVQNKELQSLLGTTGRQCRIKNYNRY